MSLRKSIRKNRSSRKSSKKLSSKKLSINDEEEEQVAKLQKMIRDNLKLEKDQEHQRQIEKALKQIREKEDSHKSKEENIYKNEMISEIIDLCFDGNEDKRFSIFELAEHYCSETTKSMNKNTIQTIKKLALSSGISKEEIENKSAVEICTLIKHGQTVPNIGSRILYNIKKDFRNIFTWSASSFIKHLKEELAIVLFKNRYFIYNSVFQDNVITNLTQKAIWLGQAQDDINLINHYIRLVSAWSDLGESDLSFNNLFNSRIRTMHMGKLSNKDRETLARLSTILNYILNKVNEHRAVLDADKEVHTELERLREQQRREAEERARREREEALERRHQERMQQYRRY